MCYRRNHVLHDFAFSISLYTIVCVVVLEKSRVIVSLYQKTMYVVKVCIFRWVYTRRCMSQEVCKCQWVYTRQWVCLSQKVHIFERVYTRKRAVSQEVSIFQLVYTEKTFYVTGSSLISQGGLPTLLLVRLGLQIKKTMSLLFLKKNSQEL